MNIISTWIYLDPVSEESKYPQVNGKSSSLKFQETYWRCVIVFFSSSLRFNKDKRHILFTNTDEIPTIEDFDLHLFFTKNNIEIINVENKYVVPKGFYGQWNNQFYEFSILEYLSKNIHSPYNFLMLDSDCVFNNSIDYLFNELDSSTSSAFTYVMEYGENQNINGLNRIQLKTIFTELNFKCDFIPEYSGGEVLFAKSNFISDVCNDFPKLWNELMVRHQKGTLKFNEEAHALSYYYYKFNTDIGKLNGKIKRCWTNPMTYRNIENKDRELDIIHLPSEKTKGLKKLSTLIILENLSLEKLSNHKYSKIVNELLSAKKYYLNVRELSAFIIKKLIRR